MQSEIPLPDPAGLLAMAGRPAGRREIFYDRINTEFRHRANNAIRECLVWNPYCPEKTNLVTALNSPFEMMPKHLSVATDEDIVGTYKTMTFKRPDSVVCLGRLDPESYALFSLKEPLPRDRNKTTFWVKTPGEKRLVIPADLSRFLPAIDLHVQAEQANLPAPSLWKYMRIRVALDSGSVEGGVHQRIGNRPHQDLGGQPSAPISVAFANAAAPELKIPYINGNLYIVHDEAPTIFLRDVPYLPEGDDPSYRKAQLCDPVSFENGAVIKYNYFTWHLAGKVSYPTFRNFMAIQTDIDRKMLANDMQSDPELRADVSRWFQQNPRPEKLFIPESLSPSKFMRRHDASDIYNYNL